MVSAQSIKTYIKKRIKPNLLFYFMLIPATVLVFIFNYMPMYGVLLAFKKYSIRLGIMGSPWVGFKNFEKLFDLPQFWVAFKNTFVINLLKLLFCFPAPILLAVMVNAVYRRRVKRFIQTVVYLPHFISWVIIAGMIFSLFDMNGVFKGVFEMLGLYDFDAFGNNFSFLGIVVFSDMWKETGWGSIIYVAALMNINPELYEAAKVDGAGTVKMFWLITLPLLLPTISVMLILRVGGLISGGFDQMYNLYNEKVYDVADILDTFTYRYGLGRGQFELGTCIGLFSNVINICLLLLANTFVRITRGTSLF